MVLHLDYDETRAWPAFAHTPLLVLAQSITVSLQELPVYAVRMNVWPGFAANKQVEMVAAEPHKDLSTQILASFQLMPLFIPDVVGMISPRAVAGILQEANLAVQDDLASTTDIDLAMKLGTNYPKGPFEWMQLLGPEKCQCLWQCLQDDAAN